MLSACANGFGALALAGLLAEEAAEADGARPAPPVVRGKERGRLSARV